MKHSVSIPFVTQEGFKPELAYEFIKAYSIKRHLEVNEETKKNAKASVIEMIENMSEAEVDDLLKTINLLKSIKDITKKEN